MWGIGIGFIGLWVEGREGEEGYGIGSWIGKEGGEVLVKNRSFGWKKGQCIGYGTSEFCRQGVGIHLILFG